MKPGRIALFFAAVIAALAVACTLFPREGVEVAGHEFYLPPVPPTREAPTQPMVEEPAADTTAELDATPWHASLYVADTARYPLSTTHCFSDTTDLRFWLPDSAFFDAFWEAAEQARGAGRILRVMHYGDSQIEMDRITCRLRSYMQRTFGGGGPGMLPFRTIIPTYAVRQYATGDLTHLSSFGDSTVSRSPGNYGPMMQCFRLSGSGATLTVKSSQSTHVDDAAKRFKRVQLVANNRGSLSADFSSLKGKKSSQHLVAPQGVCTLSWSADSITEGIRLHVSGSADLYAVTIDGDGGGVAVDNIPMRGCSGQQFTLVDEQMLTAAYSTLDVGMIIMQFGGNSVPYFKNSQDISTYCQSIGKQIAYVHRCCPKAKILFIGPSDMSIRIRGELQTYPVIPELIDSLAATATANGVAYWSIYHAMGGRNSMPQWTRQGLAGNDYIHFSQKGADKMGDLLAEAFYNSHMLYTLERKYKSLQERQGARKKGGLR